MALNFGFSLVRKARGCYPTIAIGGKSEWSGVCRWGRVMEFREALLGSVGEMEMEGIFAMRSLMAPEDDLGVPLRGGRKVGILLG